MESIEEANRRTDSSSPASSQCSSVVGGETFQLTLDNKDNSDDVADAEEATNCCDSEVVQQQDDKQQHWQQQHQQRQQQHQQRQREFQRDSYQQEDVNQVELFGVRIVALTINGKDRLCLAQISNTLLKEFSYNEIHNRRVALGITCIQCTPIQLEMLRRAGAMPSSSRRCGMITMREAERLCRSFLVEEQPPELPENFYFTVAHRVNYGCKGRFVPARYISSRAKCIECFYCGEFYSPNKFIFHSHRQPNSSDCNPPDSPNINSWRKHIDLDWSQEQSQEIRYAWEDVKSLFNGGTRRRAQPAPLQTQQAASSSSSLAAKRISSSAQNRAKSSAGPTSASLGDEDADNDELLDVVCGDERRPPIDSGSSRANRCGHSATKDDLVSRQRTLMTNKRTHSGSMLNSATKRQVPATHQIYRHHQSSRSSILSEHEQQRGGDSAHHRGANPFMPANQCGGGGSQARLAPLIGAGSNMEQQKQIGGNSNPLLIAPDANFIHSQLYSQLMQPQQQQPQQQQQLHMTPADALDAQAAAALRHHLWTSLLANLQCNFTANANNHQTATPIYPMSAAQQQQQQQPLPTNRLPPQTADLGASSLQTRASIEHLLAVYPQVGATSKLHLPSAAEMNLAGTSYTASQ